MAKSRTSFAAGNTKSPLNPLNKKGGPTKVSVTTAQKTMDSLGYSPVDAQIQAVKKLHKLVMNGTATSTELQLFVKMNTDLIAYESSKAAIVTESDVTTNGESLPTNTPAVTKLDLAKLQEELRRSKRV